MDINIKEKVEEIASKIKGSSSLMGKFKTDPVKLIESLIGVDLPCEQVKKIVELVKLKLGGDDIIGGLQGLKGILGK